MMPIYETADNLTREQDVADHVSRAWKRDLVKTAKLASFDFFAVRDNQIKALVEIKVRTNAHDKYPTYMISAEKIYECLMRTIVYKVPFYLVVGFTDCVMFYAPKTEDYTLEIGGRTDRNDSADIEAVCHVPMDMFKVVI